MNDSSQNTKKSLEILASSLSPDAELLTDEKSCFRASFDNLRLSFIPSAVISPANEDDISVILELANTNKIPVTTRGGGTATTGAASPSEGGWVLNLAEWNNFHIDEVSGLAYVQPGVRLEEIQNAALSAGWFFPPDPSSAKHCTIGGAIATNAGGLRAAKYGVTRDYVYALEGFLPTGEWVRWGMDLKKFASGYNIRDLWIGSEGTLGVITGAVLKLIPPPSSKWTCLLAYKNETDALSAVHAILTQRLSPAILEFLDRQTVKCYETMEDKAVFEGYPDSSILLLEFDTENEIDQARHFIENKIGPEARAMHVANSREEAQKLWAVRRKCSAAMFQLGNAKINEDVVVPLDKQIELLAFTRELKERTQLATPTFGHAADGNFHVHIMFDRDDPEQLKKAEKAVDEVMAKVVELGGAITGEHGIGLAKTPYLSLQHNPAEIKAMQAIKKALDPNNILNPGKIFDSCNVWRQKRVTVTLPWDHR